VRDRPLPMTEPEHTRDHAAVILLIHYGSGDADRGRGAGAGEKPSGSRRRVRRCGHESSSRAAPAISGSVLVEAPRTRHQVRRGPRLFGLDHLRRLWTPGSSSGETPRWRRVGDSRDLRAILTRHWAGSSTAATPSSIWQRFRTTLGRSASRFDRRGQRP
jgi:hypothetical protein